MGELIDIQRAIAETRSQRGFTNDPVRLLVLLTEEVGEVAREVKKTWSPNYGPPNSQKLTEELADCLVVLCALASAHQIDLQAAVEEKFFGKDEDRTWASASSPVIDP
jgi:NTP pyrophosphatase (non-canonical NTP hydrolase)